MERRAFTPTIATDLFEAIRAKEYSSETRDFLFDAVTNLEALMELLPDPRSDYDAIVASLESLADLIEHGEYPQEYFNILSYGYNKECYDFSPHFVIKFCAARNPSEEEEALLLAAFFDNVEEAFVPTKYCKLPRELISQVLDKEEEDIYDPDDDEWYPAPDWKDNTRFTYICFQPRIAVESEESPEFHPPGNWTAKKAAVGLPEEEEVGAWICFADTPCDWVAALINHFGVEQSRLIAIFCYDHCVYDLHGSNVGYWNGVPIILDWLSNSPYPSNQKI